MDDTGTNRSGAEAAGKPGTSEPDTTTSDSSGPGFEPGTTSGTPPDASAASPIQEQVIEVLRSCFDPEIPVNIYDLGLIYSVQVDPPGVVNIRMTLTSPMCPVAGSLPPEVEAKVRNVPGVSDAKVEVVWDPPWGPAMMSEAARLSLNI